MTTIGLNTVVEIYDTITAIGYSMIPVFQEEGLWLLTAFGVISICWVIFETLLSDGSPQQFVTKLVLPGVKLSILAWIIRDLPTLSVDLIQGFDQLAVKALGQSLAGGNLMRNVMSSALVVAESMWDAIDAPGVWETIKGFGAPAAVFVVRVALVLLVLATGILQGCIFLLSQIMVLITLAFGPILLPFMVLGPFSYMADGWQRYLIKTSLVKIVGAVIIIMSRSMNGFLAQISTSTGSAASLDLGVVAITGLVVAILLALSFQTFAIAEGIVSGSGSPRMPTLSQTVSRARSVIGAGSSATRSTSNAIGKFSDALNKK